MSLETAQRPAATAEVTPAIPLPPLPAHWRSLPRVFVHRPGARGTAGAGRQHEASLSYAETFLRAVVLGRVLTRMLGPEPYVGLLVPPTVPSAVANLRWHCSARSPST